MDPHACGPAGDAISWITPDGRLSRRDRTRSLRSEPVSSTAEPRTGTPRAVNWPGDARGGVTTRRGGESRGPWSSLNLGGRTGDDPGVVARNLDRLSEATGLPLARAARIGLVHGARVVAVDRGGPAGRADGLVTTRPEVVLALTVADCYPLLLAAEGRAVGIVHCGWRSAIDGIAGRAVARIVEESRVPAARLHAWIGPGIGACCFEVGAEVADRFPEDVRHTRPTPRGDRTHIDLTAFLRLELQGAGLPDERISAAGRCTACEPETFYSHRRDRGVTGRMLAWIVRKSAP